MLLFLFIFNLILSFVVSEEIVFIDDDTDVQVIRELEKKEIKGAFICAKPDNSTIENDTVKKCRIHHTNCTEYLNEICVCKKEYATREGDEVYCDYKRKKQLTAFLLELFVGFGSGHFYRQSYLIAGLKLAAFLFGIYIICLFPLTVKCFDNCCQSDCLIVMVSLFFFLCSVGLAFWFIFDLVKFGKNKYPDKNGIALMKW